MAMNDEETVALIAGGHTLVKYMVLQIQRYVGPEPSGQELKSKDLVGKNSFVLERRDTISSGLEGAWVLRYKVDNNY
jgi:catalase-peroxidase